MYTSANNAHDQIIIMKTSYLNMVTEVLSHSYQWVVYVQ